MHLHYVECTSCDLRDRVPRPNNHRYTYKIDENQEVEMVTSICWCEECESVTRSEVLSLESFLGGSNSHPKSMFFAQGIRSIDEELSDLENFSAIKYLFSGANKISSIRKEIREILNYVQMLQERKSNAKCLDCGGDSIVQIPIRELLTDTDDWKATRGKYLDIDVDKMMRMKDGDEEYYKSRIIHPECGGFFLIKDEYTASHVMHKLPQPKYFNIEGEPI